MYPKLLHIYGPFFIQSYGVCIVVGLLIYTYLLYNDTIRKRLVTPEQFQTLLSVGIVSAMLGGRLLYFLTQDYDSLGEFFQIWQGGFAILGSIIGVMTVIPLFLKRYKIPLLPALDRVTLYAPLMQSIARIGCFLAGCCYGKPTEYLWAVRYTNQDCSAPLYQMLHPTQLYSSLLLLIIFGILYYVQKYCIKNGNLAALYLLLTSTERFVLDFYRGDQILTKTLTYLSNYQVIALILMIGSFIFLLISSLQFKPFGGTIHDSKSF